MASDDAKGVIDLGVPLEPERHTVRSLEAMLRMLMKPEATATATTPKDEEVVAHGSDNVRGRRRDKVVRP